MIIALPARDGKIDDHFGHCDHFVLMSIEDSKIVSEEKLASPEGCGCKSNIASILQEKGVEVMLAGNMGQGAVNVLHSCGIQVIRGCSGELAQVAQDWIDGKIKDQIIVCNHDCHH